MCVYVYVCMYVYIYICIYTHNIYIYIYVYAYTYITRTRQNIMDVSRETPDATTKPKCCDLANILVPVT